MTHVIISVRGGYARFVRKGASYYIYLRKIEMNLNSRNLVFLSALQLSIIYLLPGSSASSALPSAFCLIRFVAFLILKDLNYNYSEQSVDLNNLKTEDDLR